MENNDYISEKLFALQDKSYQAFNRKLIPTIPSEIIIGVRTPLLRNLAKDLSGTPQAEDFLRCLPHQYLEENNLHAFLSEKIKDYDRALMETERFLPYIDNWATCDCFSPKIFAKHKAELLAPIRRWLNDDKLYTVRFAIGMLMRTIIRAAVQRSLRSLVLYRGIACKIQGRYRACCVYFFRVLYSSGLLQLNS